jgi:hypothetical protein
MASNGDIITKFGAADAEKLVSLARVAEQAERYDDMCKFMKALVDAKQDLSVEERNLLSVAYKNVVGSRRASWRTLNVDDQSDAELIKTYKAIVEDELDKICGEILDLLTKKLIPAVQGKADESEVFYQKMAADYYRYLSEFKEGDGDAPATEGVKATEHYEAAYNIAKEQLPETHPTRLGLALNYSVCYYEILKKPEKACSLAKEAFDAAIQKLDSLTDESYKDSTLIMQLLRDNLTLWTSENQEADDAAKVEQVED